MAIYIANIIAVKPGPRLHDVDIGTHFRLIPASSDDEAYGKGMKIAPSVFPLNEGWIRHECFTRPLAPMLDEINQEIAVG